MEALLHIGGTISVHERRHSGSLKSEFRHKNHSSMIHLQIGSDEVC